MKALCFTGLDAFQAERVMETLRKLAQEGHTVVCSIHQPRGSIYSKFDDLLLLSSGRVIYAGPAHESALTYFANLGYLLDLFPKQFLNNCGMHWHTWLPILACETSVINVSSNAFFAYRYKCPEHTNPAEFFADLISIDYSSSENEAASDKKVSDMVEAFARRQRKAGDLLSEMTSDDDEKYEKNESLSSSALVAHKGGWWRQFQLLLKRAWMQVLFLSLRYMGTW